MNRARIWASIAAVWLLSVGHADAQRSGRPERWVAPVEPVLLSTSEGPSSRYQVAMGLIVRGDAEVVPEARYFSLEVAERVEVVPAELGHASRARRPRVHRCSMGRPPRTPAAPTVMHAGDVWGVALDLRALCWGRALSAIEGGGTITVRYAASGRSFVARALADAAATGRRRPPSTVREIEAVSPFALPVAAAESASPGITLAPIDAASGRSLTLRVAVFGPDARTRRAWVRPDRVRFRVVDPRGQIWDCRLPRTGGTAIPDLFSRVSARRAVRFALEANAYCPGAFRHAGIYEVTPVVELDEDGAAWELDALTGTFMGRTTPVRVRSGEGTLVRPLSTEDARRLFR